MNVFYLILGILIFIAISFDIILATFTLNGGGVITNVFCKWTWKLFFFASKRNGYSRILDFAGPTILIGILCVWILGLWGGMLLLLLSDSSSILNGKTMVPAGMLEKLYYAGFTLSSLGIGDYTASNNLWRIVTSISSFTGLAFITAAITYIVSVLTAVNLQNKLSLYIFSMGKTPQEVLLNSWNGKDFSSLLGNSSNLCEMLMKHTLDHHAYPLVHYFHKSQSNLAVKKCIVLLDETIQFLEYRLASTIQHDSLQLTMLRTALDSYLEMVKVYPMVIRVEDEQAPVPDMEALIRAGVPLSTSSAMAVAEEEAKEHRKQLTALLRNAGWSWKDVYGKS
ncbi:potassium channel family protein [Telluribacter sp.]|jgi:hypothetical protein|uniref:potassium channel family protein n=1 Tax=Telluribacter sp. TaxID=1978767 RepID=UPI002E157639|nr:potassium channel family protein [Telluribacter sp.]